MIEDYELYLSLNPPLLDKILSMSAEFIFLFVLIILGIILIKNRNKNRNILKPNKRKFILFLALFIFLSSMPILLLSIHSCKIPNPNTMKFFSLFQIFTDLLYYKIYSPPPFPGSRCLNDFSSINNKESLLIIIPLLAIISYTFSCLIISAYDKFKIKKIK